jgi:hypothetical protein
MSVARLKSELNAPKGRHASAVVQPTTEQLLVLCQGCPGLAQVQRPIQRITWAADVPAVATWIEDNQELDISRPSKHVTTSWIQLSSTGLERSK